MYPLPRNTRTTDSLRPGRRVEFLARRCRACAACALLLIVLFAVAASGQERWQSRSLILTTQGVAATSQTPASQVAALVLGRGGSVVDAAIAANAMLGVVEPMMCGIGGDLFAMHFDGQTEKLTGLNASGWAPARMTAAPQGGFTGIPTVTVPGAVDGWWKMHQKFGRLLWAELFAPAIRYARNGFPVTEIMHEDRATSGGKWPGRVPAVVEIWKTPDLARANEIIARQGRDGFYKGPLAADILETSARLGRLLASNDFPEYESEFVEPLSTTYRGARVFELPPNGQGDRRSRC